MPAPTIWLGDLARAIGALTPDEPTIGVIADMLGLATAVPVRRRPAREQRTAEAEADGGSIESARTSPAPRYSVSEVQPLLPRTVPARAVTPPRRLELSVRVAAPVPDPPPLLSPLAGRFIAQELVATSRFGPHVDVHRLVDALAQGEIPQPVPLQERRTLARGVQCLVDAGEGMEPFADDQRLLVGLLRRLVGDSLVDVRVIYEAPDPADPVTPYVPPAPGVPVLALTDLGLSRRVERGTAWLVEAWQAFAMLLAERGSELVALVPYARERWPPALAARMRITAWDRATTIADAKPR